jgi:hypothetical protein
MGWRPNLKSGGHRGERASASSQWFARVDALRATLACTTCRFAVHAGLPVLRRSSSAGEHVLEHVYGFRYLVKMSTIKESRTIEPFIFAHLVSSTLHSRRFGPYFTVPVFAGLERTPSGGFKPYIAGADLIGCLNFAED